MRTFFPKSIATTIGKKAIWILSASSQSGSLGTIHSVFSHSFNVIGARGLLTGVCGNLRHPAVVNLPEHAQSFLQEIHAGWNVQREPWGFSVLKPSNKVAMSIDLCTAQLWDGGTTRASRQKLATLVRSLVDTASGSFHKKSLKEVSSAYMQWGHGSGLGDLIPVVCGQSSEVRISRSLNIFLPPIAQLISSLKQNNPKGLCNAIGSLLGMGPGLTPSGDDFLGGLVATWVLVGSALGVLTERVATLRRVISKYSFIRTSTISRHLLNYASEGLVCDLFYSLICSLALGKGDVMTRARAAIQWGGTSGEDTTLGICLAFRLAPKWALAACRS